MNEGAFHVDFLRKVVAGGGSFVARFSLHRDPLSFIKPTFYLELSQSGVRSFQPLAWSPELEKYLLFEYPTRMSSEDEEAERFAAILMNNLETAGHTYGRDYANSVFVDLLRDREHYGLASLLHETAALRPSRGSGRYPQCRQFLEQSLDGLRTAAEANLGYPAEDAERLVIASLRIVLDETFHISARQALFGPSSGTGR